MESSGSTIQNTPLATFSGKGFLSGSIGFNIALVTLISLVVMTTLLQLGLHPFAVTGAFMICLYLLITWRSGHITYSLYDWGMEQYVVPVWGKKQAISRKILWVNIKDYQIGSDLNRGFREYNYLKLRSVNPSMRIKISDTASNMNSFLTFREQFESLVQNHNSANGAQFSDKPLIPIKRKKDFYQTTLAKLITGFFIAMSLAFIWYAIRADSIRTSNLFRIFVVIVPGTIYLSYRVFYRKGR